MDLLEGFLLDSPNVMVPWHITEPQLESLFPTENLRRVTDGYFVIECTALSGLPVSVGFHFEPRKEGKLEEFEFFHAVTDLAKSFHMFQYHLEVTFGPATKSFAGTEGFPTYQWNLSGGEVFHSVRERFGPAERVRIRPATI